MSTRISLHSQSGATLVQAGVLLILVAGISIVGLRQIGEETRCSFVAPVQSLDSSGGNNEEVQEYLVSCAEVACTPPYIYLPCPPPTDPPHPTACGCFELHLRIP